MNYAAKQKKRKDKEGDRDARAEAKQFFVAHTGRDPAAFRQKITEIKKIILELKANPSPQEQEELEQDLAVIIYNAKNQKQRS